MQFGGYDLTGLEVSEIRTVELDKTGKLQMLHEGFKSRFVDENKNYLGFNETASKGIASFLEWDRPVTPELLPQLYDAAKDMIKGGEIDGKPMRSLSRISEYARNKAYMEANKRQHAGYAAELISTWKENAQAIKDGTGYTTYVVDNLSDEFRERVAEMGISLRKNDPYVDKIRINDKGVVEKIQSKFVGGDAKGCLQKLMSSKYDKYFNTGRVDAVEIPKDFYPDVKNLIAERRVKLEKQIEYLKTVPEKEDVLLKRITQLERLGKVDDMIRQSTVRYNEAKFAVEHHKLYVTKLFAEKVVESGHGKGFESGIEAAALTTAISTVDNIQKYVSGEITATDAVKDIVKDVGLAGAAGYGTGFVEGVVANSMRASGHEMLSKMGKAGIPAAVITFAVESYDITMDFAQGEIPASEYAYELGKNAVSTAGGVAGAAMLSKIPGGGVLGGMAGAAVATAAYTTAVEYGGKGAEALAAKAQEMADKAVEAAKDEIPDKLDLVRNSINGFAAENNVPIRV